MGHPDYQANVSSPTPVFIQSFGPFPQGLAFGPVTIQVPAGGSYLISVSAGNNTNALLVDFTIDHLDDNGLVVYEDFFGAVAGGQLGPSGIQTLSPVVLRGNIYGSSLKISGVVASSAVVNTILGTAGVVASGVKFNVYTLPLFLGDPEPRMSCGNFNDSGGNTPGGLLALLFGTPISPGQSIGNGPMAPYSGPAVISLQQSGLATTPTNLLLILNGFTVQAAGSQIVVAEYRTQFVGVGESFPFNFPACFFTWTLTNQDGAQTATPRFSIIADRTA
jgi:hypothetical protein